MVKGVIGVAFNSLQATKPLHVFSWHYKGASLFCFSPWYQLNILHSTAFALLTFLSLPPYLTVLYQMYYMHFV